LAQAPPPGSVTTWRYDNGRTGQNTNETILSPSNVISSQFGKLFSLPVDDQVYAQPLYIPNVTIPGKGTHNVLYVATEFDTVYAFDADSNTGANAAPLWKVSMIDMAHGAATGAAPEAERELKGTANWLNIVRRLWWNCTQEQGANAVFAPCS